MSHKSVVHNCFRLYRPKENVLVISASSPSLETFPVLPLWHSLFSNQQGAWVETQCSQLWEAEFQIVLASVFWIFVEWSGFNAFSYIRLSFLESDSWGKSLLCELLTPCYLPTAIIALFTLMLPNLTTAPRSSTASPSVHVTTTLWPPSTPPYMELKKAPEMTSVPAGTSDMNLDSEESRPRTGRRQGGCWWLIVCCHQCCKADLSPHRSRVNMTVRVLFPPLINKLIFKIVSIKELLIEK